MLTMPDPFSTSGTNHPKPMLVRLAEVAARMPPPVFAVIDGGQFDDFPGMLMPAFGLLSRSLFLGEGSQSSQQFGPWLVSIQQSEDIATVLDIVGDLPALVFWSNPASGEAGLFHHLRRLNRVRVPTWAAEGKIGPDPDDPDDRRTEAVLFRHWDPRVLAALLPVLNETGFSRIIGPAQEIAFAYEDYGDLKRVISDPDWPITPTGMMTLTSDQMLALARRRLA